MTSKYTQTKKREDMSVLEEYISGQLVLLYALAECDIVGSCFDMLVEDAIEQIDGGPPDPSVECVPGHTGLTLVGVPTIHGEPMTRLAEREEK